MHDDEFRFQSLAWQDEPRDLKDYKRQRSPLKGKLGHYTRSLPPPPIPELPI
jgi:hypothetical protein